MKKIKPIRNTWYDWWINYITELITNILGVFKDKTVLSNTNKPKQTVYKRWKNLSKPKAQKTIWRKQNKKSFSIKKETK